MKLNDFVLIRYSIKIKESNEVVDTKERVICLGQGWLNKFVEDKIIESDENKLVIEVPPEKAFGYRNPNALRLVTESFLKKHGINNVSVGMFIVMDNYIGVVRSVNSGRVLVDFNHPLSGKTLIYEVEVLKKIENEKEKIESLVEQYANLKPKDIKINDKITLIFDKKIEENVKKLIGEKVKEILNKEVIIEFEEKK